MLCNKKVNNYEHNTPFRMLLFTPHAHCGRTIFFQAVLWDKGWQQKPVLLYTKLFQRVIGCIKWMIHCLQKVHQRLVGGFQTSFYFFVWSLSSVSYERNSEILRSGQNEGWTNYPKNLEIKCLENQKFFFNFNFIKNIMVHKYS